ncbi:MULTISPECIES: lysoplasmalogenase family protein [unclassified Flavobacterium]|uniref:lysoplasmalogenase family protein n=1 Tax=unclassified Flavobacterium TaxID=196869 RepID=UPI003614783F
MIAREIKNSNKSEEKLLLVLFFFVSFAEIFAEFFNKIAFVYILKPLIIPILTLIYWKTSTRRNPYFLVSMFFALLANLLFISRDFTSIVLASTFFLLHRTLVIYLVLKNVKIKRFLPVFLGSIPFLTVFAYLTFMTMDELGEGFGLYIIQVLFMSFLGGFALSNYIIEENKMNYWLLINSILFAVIQFIIVLKLFYVSMVIFQPISMILYVFAQYALYKFMILAESNKER